MAYPNVLVLRYLRETGQVAPEIEMKAEGFINASYQRLLKFESPRGGFNWFGDPSPGNVLLTSLALQLLYDMALVFPVDERVLERNTNWLLAMQEKDGSWVEKKLPYLYRSMGENKLRTTALVVWTLLQVGQKGKTTNKGLRYLRTHLKDAKGDLYTLALVANALSWWKPKHQVTRGLLKKLHRARKQTAKGSSVHWTTEAATSVNSRGDTAAIETTALVAMAFMKAKRYPGAVAGAQTFLVQNKDAYGNWSSTQATILALKTLLAGFGSAGKDADMSVAISLDGKRIGQETFEPNNSDVLRLIDGGLVEAGQHSVELRVKGQANVMYQIVGRYYEPWGKKQKEAKEPLTISLEYDQKSLYVDDIVTAKVAVSYKLERPAFMVIVDLGIPPGFEVDKRAFDELVKDRKIERYSLTGRQITLYLGELKPLIPFEFRYELKAKFPIRAKTPRSVAYEYYTPSSRGVQEPVLLVVEKD